MIEHIMDQMVSFLHKLWKFLYFKNQLSKKFSNHLGHLCLGKMFRPLEPPSPGWRGKRKRSIWPPMDPISISGKKSAVANLSRTVLTPAPLSVLELRLSFVPTPSVSPFELVCKRRKNIREFLMKSESCQNEVILILKVIFVPLRTEITW